MYACMYVCILIYLCIIYIHHFNDLTSINTPLWWSDKIHLQSYGTLRVPVRQYARFYISGIIISVRTRVLTVRKKQYDHYYLLPDIDLYLYVYLCILFIKVYYLEL